MTLPLIITPEAEEDVAEAKAWYNRKRAGLGDEFVLSVEAALDHIRRVPGGATEIAPGVLRVVVRRIPYGVFYQVDQDQIAVVAVYSRKRDPRGWQGRV